jgi:hypothetical protein
MKTFKPQLLPNNKAGEAPDWEELIKDPQAWLYSNKLDGARVEIKDDGEVVGRSLKSLPSIHINYMAREIAQLLKIQEGSIIEAEFYSPEMNFAEIMHFFRTEDVTSTHTLQKYLKLWKKTGGHTENGWPYPGRSVEWLTTWHDSLKFYAFDVVNIHNPAVPKAVRTLALGRYCDDYKDAMGELSLDLVMIKQVALNSIDEMYQMFDQAIIDGCEGVVAMHKNSNYKFGRHTLNSKQAFKIKDDNQGFDGVIIGVGESTVAIEGAPKTTNELGRSVTSKLKEHRQPSGMAKGFEVLMDDGRKLDVSLKGFDHPARIKMLQEPLKWIGETIRFTGMHPVKPGGVPRHAHYTKGNIRDAK